MARHLDPTPLGTGESAKLIAHYRANGESEHVAPVEAALTDEWLAINYIAERSGKSPHYCRKALEYLACEGRAERAVQDRRNPQPGSVPWRYVFRRPQR